MEMVIAPPNTGNLFSIYKRLKKREIKAIEKQANALPSKPIHAECAAEQGQWLIITTMPGEEGVASGHLIGRGFGVFQPRYQSIEIRRGRKIERTRPMFPGYLFVYVWGIDQNARRILACTGVSDFLRHPDSKPAIVPWSVINDIRAQENRENPMTLRMDELNGKARKRMRHNKKSRRKASLNPEVAVCSSDLDIVSVRTWGFSKSLGTWDDDDQGRIGALHKALGLAA